jgi:hypothetical protein
MTEETTTVALDKKRWERVTQFRTALETAKERLDEKADAHKFAKKRFEEAQESFTEAFDELRQPKTLPLFQQAEANTQAVEQPWVKALITKLDEAEGLPADSGVWGTRALLVAGWDETQRNIAGLWCDQMENWKLDPNATMDNRPNVPEFMLIIDAEVPATVDAGQPGDDLIDCAKCEGTGEVANPDGIPGDRMLCDDCTGTGTVIIPAMPPAADVNVVPAEALIPDDSILF